MNTVKKIACALDASCRGDLQPRAAPVGAVRNTLPFAFPLGREGALEALRPRRWPHSKSSLALRGYTFFIVGHPSDRRTRSPPPPVAPSLSKCGPAKCGVPRWLVVLATRPAWAQWGEARKVHRWQKMFGGSGSAIDLVF